MVIYDHNGRPIKSKFAYMTKRMLERAKTQLLMETFGQSKFFEKFVSVILGPDGKPFKTNKADKKIKFRRYNTQANGDGKTVLGFGTHVQLTATKGEDNKCQ